MSLNGEEVVTIVSVGTTVLVAWLTYKTNKDLGATLRSGQGTVNAALTNSHEEFSDTRRLLGSLIEQQGSRLAEISRDVAHVRAVLDQL